LAAAALLTALDGGESYPLTIAREPAEQLLMKW
jgi:hypothetical protein